MKTLITLFKNRMRNNDSDVCAGKRCTSYTCTTLPKTDFRELLPFSELSDLTTTTTTTTICNTVLPQLNSDHFNQAHDVTLP